MVIAKHVCRFAVIRDVILEQQGLAMTLMCQAETKRWVNIFVTCITAMAITKHICRFAARYTVSVSLSVSVRIVWGVVGDQKIDGHWDNRNNGVRSCNNTVITPGGGLFFAVGL